MRPAMRIVPSQLSAQKRTLKYRTDEARSNLGAESMTVPRDTQLYSWKKNLTVKGEFDFIVNRSVALPI